MGKYHGVIIEESLADKKILNQIKIISTKVEAVTEKHQTPWLTKWTLHTVEVERGEVEMAAQKISASLDRTRSHSWYADINDGEQEYIIFPNRIFRINMCLQTEYDKAREYGVLIGIPEYQVDFKAGKR
ncbi:MAG: hypothetical protein EXS51_00155 [Candidatus Taylorbacteria bacterium]|nr:hypothetical protein [Candidatus Taylorbacteria bacterium]